MKPEPNENTLAEVDEASIKEEFDELGESEDHSVDGEDSDEELVPNTRKSKRARSSIAKPKAPRKRYVKGKQGGLEGMMKMPLEIFTEIAYHITPGDLIALIRCSKFFRNMLLRRSAGLIWQRAAENVPGLPPCPTEMCEPQYAALMFSKHCTLCGATATAKPDPYLQVRLCSACRDTRLEGQASSRDFAGLVSRSDVSRPNTKGGARKIRNFGPQYYSLRTEVQEVREKITELQRSKDRSAYPSWVGARRETIQLRNKEANVLQRYIDSTSKSRDEELADARKQRRETIHSRLKELGWTTADLLFHSSHAKPWNALVETSKPLTDRIWSNILPKLVTLLEENRARRLEYERLERRIERRERLDRLLLKMKRSEHPFAAAHAVIKPHPGSELPLALDSDLSGDSDSDSDSSLSHKFPSLTTSWGMQRQRAVVRNPFPGTAVALEWECLNDLGEMEISLERVEELFNERQEQIRQRIVNWRTGFERRLVEIYSAGTQSAAPGAAVETPVSEETKAEPVVQVKGSTDTTKDLPPDVRFLLRADTIFKRDTSNDLPHFTRPAFPELQYYPDIISYGEFFNEGPGWPSPPVEDINIEKYHRYTRAEKIVKAMLADIQVPDAARMELDAMQARFACGRCTERKPMRWDDLVVHYMEQQKQWKQDSAETGFHPTRHPVVFRNVHDVEWTTNPKPLLRILTAEEASRMNVVPVTEPERIQCQLCKGTGRFYWASIDDVKVHLQDVHDIADPTEGLHYGSRRYMSPMSDIISDEWHKEWDAFHDAQALAPAASFSIAGPQISSPL
ncbi:hypothetical protein BDV93DRAFT_480023 [Ceratobasidium sp. AG-I]|nr:hypothetical protein BDV93DRAFT_480023 [Ceratobasidium sp. AG-I]